MKNIEMDGHDFHKQNLVTTNKGDLYKCNSCGVSGYRLGLLPMIRVNESDYRKSLKCTHAKPYIQTDTIYIVVDSPWRDRLPVGTEIKRTKPPYGKLGDWFVRADGEILFPEGTEPYDKEGKFKLFNNEFKINSL